MSLLRKALVPLAGVAVIALVISVAGPRAVHAIVATVVQDVDNAARHPFYGHCSVLSSLTHGDGGSCVISVPAGEEVVLQTERLYTTADPKNTKVLNYLMMTTAGGFEPVYTDAVGHDTGFYQPAFSADFSAYNWTLYADPGTSITCGASTRATNPVVGLELDCTLTGYYVTLAAGS